MGRGHPARTARGFTILELIMALFVFAILVAIASAGAMRAKNAAYLAQMESDLHELALAQEAYNAETGRYFDDDIARARGGSYTPADDRLEFTPSPGVRIEVRANPKAWTAQASHEKRDPRRFFCAIYMGDIEPFPPARNEGVVQCTPRRGGDDRDDDDRGRGDDRDDRGRDDRGRDDRGRDDRGRDDRGRDDDHRRSRG